jgi:hypothetical protein
VRHLGGVKIRSMNATFALGQKVAATRIDGDLAEREIDADVAIARGALVLVEPAVDGHTRDGQRERDSRAQGRQGVNRTSREQGHGKQLLGVSGFTTAHSNRDASAESVTIS